MSSAHYRLENLASVLQPLYQACSKRSSLPISVKSTLTAAYINKSNADIRSLLTLPFYLGCVHIYVESIQRKLNLDAGFFGHTRASHLMLIQ
jgi:hypothetical protein